MKRLLFGVRVVSFASSTSIVVESVMKISGHLNWSWVFILSPWWMTGAAYYGLTIVVGVLKHFQDESKDGV